MAGEVIDQYVSNGLGISMKASILSRVVGDAGEQEDCFKHPCLELGMRIALAIEAVDSVSGFGADLTRLAQPHADFVVNEITADNMAQRSILAFTHCIKGQSELGAQLN